MALLNDNRKIKDEPLPGQGRSLGRPTNPDWEGGRRQAQSANQERFNQPGNNVIQLHQQQNKAGGYNRPTVDQLYDQTAFGNYLHGPLGLGKEASNDAKYKDPSRLGVSNDEQYEEVDAEPEMPAQPQYIPNQPPRQPRPKQKERLKLPPLNVIKDAKDRVTVTRITATNVWWLSILAIVQMIFALISIVCFGFVYALDSALNADKGADSGSYLGWLVNKALAVASSAVNSFLQFIGVDFSEIAFYIALACYALIMFIGMISIFAMYVQYIIFGLKPLGGRSSGLKHGMMLLAWIGYCTPLLNMFPFVALWIATVWYHPK